MKLFTQLFFVAIIFACVAFSHKQQPKLATVSFTQQEMEALYQIVDDAAVPGQVRKPLLQKIGVSYEATFTTPKVDSTAKHKKN